VSFLKAPGFEDGHPGYSSPLDEQTFVVNTINAIEKSPAWATSTAIIITWDDSDGWYDNQMSPILSQSNTTADALTGVGHCGTAAPGAKQGRCGYGPRLPLLVISPYAKANFVDHAVTDYTSVLRFIEDNWSLGRIGGGSLDNISGPLANLFDFTHARNVKVCLNPSTGEPATCL
jgi:phospholipase C